MPLTYCPQVDASLVTAFQCLMPILYLGLTRRVLKSKLSEEEAEERVIFFFNTCKEEAIVLLYTCLMQ